jgi:hypothetical protein
MCIANVRGEPVTDRAQEARPKKVFILYDGRAKYGDTDDAAVLCTAGSEREARHDSRTTFSRIDGIWYEYDLVNNEAVNEQVRWDLGKGLL